MFWLGLIIGIIVGVVLAYVLAYKLGPMIYGMKDHEEWLDCLTLVVEAGHDRDATLQVVKDFQVIDEVELELMKR